MASPNHTYKNILRVDFGSITACQCRIQRWTRAAISAMMAINGCLIHRVTLYSGFQDACVRFSFPVLPFHKQNSQNSNRFKLEISPLISLAAA